VLSDRHHLHLHAFPTRRSSDLDDSVLERWALRGTSLKITEGTALEVVPHTHHKHILIQLRKNLPEVRAGQVDGCHEPPDGGESRSEEHTSELQSRFDLVCRLLL